MSTEIRYINRKMITSQAMDAHVRALINAHLEEKRMTRADLARATGKTSQAITRALNGGKDGGGQLPGIWVSILEALDLRLTVEPVPAEDRKPGPDTLRRAAALLEEGRKEEARALLLEVLEGEDRKPGEEKRAGTPTPDGEGKTCA